MKQRITLLFSTLLGSLLILAFSPFYVFWLMPICLGLLLNLWFDLTPKKAFFSGFFFGLGFFGLGVSWVFISIHRFGGADIWLAGFLTLLFVATLALFPAIQALFFALAKFKNKFFAAFFFAIIWVIFEIIRSKIFTGFPWLLIGYTQVNSPLKGFAPIIGVYGIAFFTAFSGGILFLLWQFRKKIIPAITLLILFFAIWFAGFFLAQIKWTLPFGKAIKISLIQGNISQSIKWNESEIIPTLTKYQLLTSDHLDSKIIIWPEAAVPIFKQDAKDYLNFLAKKAIEKKATIILGIPTTDGKNYFNSAIAVGNGSGLYNKRRLVPFGEFVPFEKYLRGLIQFFNLPMSNFSEGKYDQPLIKADNIFIAPFICYEIAYDSLVKKSLPKANLIVVMSDDAWFGASMAEPQHMQIAQMRALESGRYVLLSTNNGITAIIAPNGKIQQTAPQFETAVLTGKIFAMKGTTPWMKY